MLFGFIFNRADTYDNIYYILSMEYVNLHIYVYETKIVYTISIKNKILSYLNAFLCTVY